MTWTELQNKVFSGVHIGKTETRAGSLVYSEVRRRIKGTKVIDVGCGDGGIAAALSKDGLDSVGLDLHDVVVVARERHPGLQFIGSDLMSSSFPVPPTPPFDTTICLDVIEHIEDDIGWLKRLSLLAPRVVLTTPSHPRKWKEQKEHLRFYPPSSMARLLALAGLILVEHLIVWEEDTGVFVAERSDLPFEERLSKSEEVALDPQVSTAEQIEVSPELSSRIAKEDAAAFIRTFFDIHSVATNHDGSGRFTTYSFTGRRT